MQKTTILPLDVIPIEDDGFHIVIEGKINGKTTRLLIDTGASRTVFDAARIREFPGVDPDAFEEMDKLSTGLGTNTMQSHTIRLERFVLGDLALENFEVVVIDMEHVNMSYRMLDIPEIDGVIGGDILADRGALVNYRQKELKLTLNS